MLKNRPLVTRLLAWYRVHRGWLGYLTIFTIAFLFFAYFQYLPLFADPDSFYHAKMAMLLRDQGWQRTFTALPFTTLAQYFADQHFLYHLLLIPFVTAFPPLIGLKLATILFGALLASTFYWFLRRWGIPWAFLTTAVLLLINPFTFRMNLAKAPSLSLIILLFGLSAAFAYRPWLVGIIGFAYVWFYGGFALLVVCVLTFALVSAIHRRYLRREDANLLVHRIRALLGRAFRHGKIRRLNLRLALAVVISTALGILLNPFFPANLRFYADQLVRIGIVNYQSAIGVGGEWYPYGLVDLLANTVLLSIPLIIALALFVINFRRQSSRSITLFFLWLFFFLLTLKSRRYVEYYVPFGLLFAAFSLYDSWRGFGWRKFWRQLSERYLRFGWAWVAVVAFATYLAILLPTVVVRDLVTEKKDLARGFRFDLFAQESKWIRQRGAPGAVVFHSDWDNFPMLFYHNDESRYIVGLDPTFLYVADQDRYWKWANVTLGKETGDVFAIVRGVFDADFVLVEHDHLEMDRLIQNDNRFSLGFNGPDAKVYVVLND